MRGAGEASKINEALCWLSVAFAASILVPAIASWAADVFVIESRTISAGVEINPGVTARTSTAPAIPMPLIGVSDRNPGGTTISRSDAFPSDPSYGHAMSNIHGVSGHNAINRRPMRSEVLKQRP